MRRSGLAIFALATSAIGAAEGADVVSFPEVKGEVQADIGTIGGTSQVRFFEVDGEPRFELRLELDGLTHAMDTWISNYQSGNSCGSFLVGQNATTIESEAGLNTQANFVAQQYFCTVVQEPIITGTWPPKVTMVDRQIRTLAAKEQAVVELQTKFELSNGFLVPRVTGLVGYPMVANVPSTFETALGSALAQQDLTSMLPEAALQFAPAFSGLMSRTEGDTVVLTLSGHLNGASDEVLRILASANDSTRISQ